MKIKFNELEERPSVHKAVGYYPSDGEMFGTLYLCSRLEAEAGFGKTPVERHHPDVVEFIMRTRKTVPIPSGWEQGMGYVSDDTSFGASFIGHWLDVPMQIGAFKRNGGEVPEEIGLVLSAYLQTGEVVNARNFRNIANCTHLKFLPLVIGPTGIRYFMYRPSQEAMQQGIVRFQEVLRRLGGLKDPRVLDSVLKEVWARVQVEQVRNLLGDDHASTARLQATETGLQFSISSTLAGYGLERGCLGFVYQDLKPGPHDARHFHYGMLLQREK